MSGSSPHNAVQVPALIAQIKAGDTRAVSRTISLLESNHPDSPAILQTLASSPPQSTIIGITGYPGAGKSTLIAQLTTVYRAQGETVGILAVDTSSPLSGGAILGDRIRMQEHWLDNHVYIRSMATRGHHGGLARATGNAIQVLNAAGYDKVLIETVGVGQEEGEITQLAHVVIAVVAPGLGDEIQAMKAGLFEVADLVVVNKADQPSADSTIQTLREWVPHVLPAIAVKGEGIQEIVKAITQHQLTV